MSHSSHAARGGGACTWTLDSCHLYLQQNVAATPGSISKSVDPPTDIYKHSVHRPYVASPEWGSDYGGASTVSPDATHPPAICQNLWGGGQLGRGGIGSSAGGSQDSATHYYHMHTSRVCVCLGAWGIEVCARIAISRLCQEESLKGLKDQRHRTPFN